MERNGSITCKLCNSITELDLNVGLKTVSCILSSKLFKITPIFFLAQKYKPILKKTNLKKIITAVVLLIAQNAFRLQQSDFWTCAKLGLIVYD